MKDGLYINIGNRIQIDNVYLKYDILDLTNTLYSSSKLDVINFLGKQEVFSYALQLYGEYISKQAELANLHNLNIASFPIYWLTPLSIKHPIFHWGKNLFLLVALLEVRSEFLLNEYQSIRLGLPSQLKSNEFELIGFAKRLYPNKEITVEFDESKSNKLTIFRGLIASFKGLLKSYSVGKKLKTYIAREEQLSDIFIGKYSSNNSEEGLCNSLKSMYQKNGKSIQLLPNDFFEKHPIPNQLMKSRPGIFQTISLAIECIISRVKIELSSQHRSSIQLSNQLVLNNKFLKRELVKVIVSDVHHFYNYCWLKNYFSSIEYKCKLIFEDEFYQVGRIISHAAAPFTNISTYGLQHGHFMELHTVYSIFDSEASSGLPLPKHFISWGEIYSEIFYLNNTFEPQYVQSLGNPNYLVCRLEGYSIPTKVEKVLWCLTTKECMLIEWEIIKGYLAENSFDLEIRLHPAPHISREEVVNLIENQISFSFSEEMNIKEAISANDIIVVSSHSTTFLDALRSNRFCIRLQSRFWAGNANFENHLLRTVGSKEEFKQAFFQFMNFESKNDSMGSIIELSEVKWDSFIIDDQKDVA